MFSAVKDAATRCVRHKSCPSRIRVTIWVYEPVVVSSQYIFRSRGFNEFFWWSGWWNQSTWCIVTTGMDYAGLHLLTRNILWEVPSLSSTRFFAVLFLCLFMIFLAGSKHGNGSRVWRFHGQNLGKKEKFDTSRSFCPSSPLQSGLWSTWFFSFCAVVTTSVSSRLLYDSDNDYWARKFTHSQEELDVASCKQLIPVKSPLSLAGLLGIVLHFAATIQNCNIPCCWQSWKCGWSSEDDTSWSQINVQGMDLAFGFLTC